MKRIIAVLAGVFLSGPALGGTFAPVNYANVTLWSFPSSPQDFNNLPTSPNDVPLNVLDFYQDGSVPIDKTFSGSALQGGQYSMHILADAEPTFVRAAFRTSYDQFHGSNMLAPYYMDGDQILPGVLPQIGYVSADMPESVTVNLNGGSNGIGCSVTVQVHVDGFNTNSWVYGGLDNNGPSSVGAFYVHSATDGEDVNIRADGSYDQTISATSNQVVGSTAYFDYGFNFAQYSPEWVGPEAADGAYLTGTIDYNFASTMRVDKVIIKLPAGSDPSKYSATFGSEANYNVEFVVAPGVPEPNSGALLAILMAALVAIAWRQRSVAQ